MANTLIEVSHLSRNYGALQAVNNVSFELAQGEVLGFLGPNGAGKSTTMQMLTGNLSPSRGSIRICGIDLLEQPRLAKAEIGYLPEQPPLYRDLTVDEYLLFAAKINRISKSQLTSAIARAKQRCGLEQVGKRLINNLSKGYQQRVGIAQAIIHSPAIVILDEPTVGLDPIQIREIRELISELGKEHGVILSTHILPEVQMTCDRVQIINKGQLVFSDEIENLNQRMQSSSLVLGLRRAPHDQELKKVTGVSDVEKLTEDRWRIHFQPGNSPADELASLAAAHDWGLYELSPEHKSLEQIFVEITSSDASSAQPSADKEHAA